MSSHHAPSAGKGQRTTWPVWPRQANPAHRGLTKPDPKLRWVLLAIAIASEVTASLSLRGALHHKGLYAVVVVGYGASFLLLGAVLRRGVPLSVAYGTWASVGVAATAGIASLLFDEPLTTLMVLGIGVLIVGVVLVECGSRGHENTVVRHNHG